MWLVVDGSAAFAGLSVADVRISGMPMCDYFSAADDEAAVAVLQTPGGPGQSSLDVVYLKNVDPVVCMAQLEAILAGCSYEEASRRPRSGQMLSSPEAESSAAVLSVSDTLCELLAAASEDDLVRAAGPWSLTEEMSWLVDAESAAGVLAALAGLARRTRASSWRLYCWCAL